MITINIDPIAFSVGAVNVRWYGLMYVVGILVAFFNRLAVRKMERLYRGPIGKKS